MGVRGKEHWVRYPGSDPGIGALESAFSEILGSCHVKAKLSTRKIIDWFNESRAVCLK
jgi:hypothetical protein